MTLLIMAAGMGSRFGGLKQATPIGPNGEFILEFSIMDAIKAGFDKVVLVIKEENLDLFRETIGKRIEQLIKVEYAFQKLENIPSKLVIPEGRVKPWGTAHAVYSAASLIQDQFAVINADDFYGRDAFFKLAHFLKTAQDDTKYHYAMIGYQLQNTMTDHGTVSRGICQTNGKYLSNIVERTKIMKKDGKIVYLEEDNWHEVAGDTIVSMNCFAFTQSFMTELKMRVETFFVTNQNNLEKVEYYLPSVVDELMKEQKCDVMVLPTEEKWYGVTYPEDKEDVMKAIATMAELYS